MVTGAEPQSEGPEMSIGQDLRYPRELSEEEIEACYNVCSLVKGGIIKQKKKEDWLIEKYDSLNKAPVKEKETLDRIKDRLRMRKPSTRKCALSNKQDEYHRKRSHNNIQLQLMGAEPKEVELPARVVPEMIQALLWEDKGPIFDILEAVET